MMVIKEVLIQWLINFLIISLLLILQDVLLEMKPTLSKQQLAEELHKLIIKKFEKRKVHSSFTDNIWGADLANMQLISKLNKGILFICVICIFSKYSCVIALKDKQSITITNACHEILTECNCKLNKILVDKGSEFYNRSMKSWLQDNNT